MRPTIDWEKRLRTEIERLRNIFLTKAQFGRVTQALLEDPGSPLAALQYNVECPAPFKGCTVGSEGAGPHDTRTLNVEDNRQTTCRIHQWAKRETIERPDDLDSLLDGLFEGYWKPTLRTESAGMPDLKRATDASTIAEETVAGQVHGGQPCSVLFCDLDNFGEVNKVLSQQEGDRVIKEFGAILESTASDGAIVLHDGGDEFVLLLPGGSPEDALTLAYEINRVVGSYDFQVSPLDIGVSMGIASTTVDRSISSFEELSERANWALNERAKKPTKGRARFHCEQMLTTNYTSIPHRLDFNYCLVKSGLLSRFPFENVWLNSLSDLIKNKASTLSEVKPKADDFIQWAGHSPPASSDATSAEAPEERFDTVPPERGMDYAFAIAHGLLRHALLTRDTSGTPFRLKLKYDEESLDSGIYLSDGQEVWASDPGANLSGEYELGDSWELESGCDPEQGGTARAILVQIGHTQPRVPLSLFAERIVVDDRPTRGGGLPDFWEATIARLVAHIVRNPNIGAIYLLGEHEHGAQTVKKLRSVDSWADESDQMAYKTGMSEGNIRTAGSLLSGKVVFPENEEELITHLATVLRSSHVVQPISRAVVSQRGPRFLSRELRMHDMALGREDGCRVKTIFEAYPVVLDIARQASGETTIIDQAGRELRELADFKVHLTDPSQDKVPAFYEQEKDSLEEYFNREFLNHEGLFRRIFEETKQLEAVLNHVVNAIGNSMHQFATRRAVLIVPHEVKEEGQDLAPLGLISIRIIPRFTQQRIRLHYGYTWRTVEALVGFPYSLYGSVRFSEYLTEEIQKRVGSKYERKIEMGQVSYIALSLHIFMDDYGQNIARRIVDDTSL